MIMTRMMFRATGMFVTFAMMVAFYVGIVGERSVE